MKEPTTLVTVLISVRVEPSANLGHVQIHSSEFPNLKNKVSVLQKQCSMLNTHVLRKLREIFYELQYVQCSLSRKSNEHSRSFVLKHCGTQRVKKWKLKLKTELQILYTECRTGKFVNFKFWLHQLRLKEAKKN